MCTAIQYKNYFGRTLDLECSYGECVTVAPRGLPLYFRHLPPMERHYALIGMAKVAEGMPLYYEAANEHGLAAAGLRFATSARYFAPAAGKDNVASFELIPWLLGQCRSLAEVRALLQRTCITADAFSPSLAPAPLHWAVADGTGMLAVESVADGLFVHADPVGVLTNEPPFAYHLTHLADYRGVTSTDGGDRFAAGLTLAPYSRGMGGMGLPGDLSSASRFVRAAFVRGNSLSEGEGDLAQFFHILGAVAHPRGCVRLPDGQNEITVYTAACDLQKGIYYYTTYENSRITAAALLPHAEGSALVTFPLRTQTDVYFEP